MSASFEYALGYTDFEHQGLIRQAQRWRTSTERLFREAGLGEGLRVLDLGSGIGDVAMLAAQIVGPSGKVVGIERDARSVERARSRIAEAGFSNLASSKRTSERSQICRRSMRSSDDSFCSFFPTR